GEAPTAAVTSVIWAPQAIQDVETIRAYVGRDSPRYADLVVERLIAAVERLRDNPRSGRIVPELGDESIREVIHGHYRIVYRVRGEPVGVARVFPGARLFRLDGARVARTRHSRSSRALLEHHGDGAAAGVDGDAGDVGGLGRGQERDDLGDLAGVHDAADGVAG